MFVWLGEYRMEKFLLLCEKIPIANGIQRVH